jgi:hypothetical protein
LVWSSSWPIVKDVVLTGAGLTLIFTQGFSGHPSVEILGFGVVLTGGTASLKVRKLLTAHVDGRTSPLPPSTPPPAPPV